MFQKKSKSLPTENPIRIFTIILFLFITISIIFWAASIFYPIRIFPLDDINSASSLVQAIIGTALSGASAFVAILIATAATKIAESSLNESKVNNKINDPDYLSSKRALIQFQKYNFLIGEILSIFRLQTQEIKLAKYSNQTEHKYKVSWGRVLDELENLLFEESFLTIGYELSKFNDNGHSEKKEYHTWSFRKSVAGLISVINDQKQIENKNIKIDKYKEILLRLQLLNHLLVKELNFLKEKTKKEKYLIEKTEYPNLYWFHQWINQLPDFIGDRDFQKLSHLILPEFHIFGDTSIDLNHLFKDLFLNPPSIDNFKKISCGTHSSSLISTITGDLNTLLKIEEFCEKFAKKIKKKAVFFDVENGIQKFDKNNFYVINATIENIHKIFTENIYRAGLNAVVILDGVRSENPIIIDSEGLADIYDMVIHMYFSAKSHGKIRSSFNDIEPNDLPKIFWIGIDYRDLNGHFDKSTNIDDFHKEIWSILHRSNNLIGIDANEIFFNSENKIEFNHIE